jgi:hypothetical protein
MIAPKQLSKLVKELNKEFDKKCLSSKKIHELNSKNKNYVSTSWPFYGDMGDFGRPWVDFIGVPLVIPDDVVDMEQLKEYLKERAEVILNVIKGIKEN